jgi:polyisoprenoid-binding protein YceI
MTPMPCCSRPSRSSTFAAIAALGLLAGAPLRTPPQQKDAKTMLPAGTWSVDSVHSTVIFKVQHMKASWAFGRFNKVSGQVPVDEKSPEKSSVSISIDVDSLDTANAKRDADLKGPSFFDAVQFSTATFASTAVKKTGNGTYSVTGDLEIHGVKKPVTADFEQVGYSDSKMGVRAGFFGKLSLKRSDYGIAAMPDGIGDDVELTISLETVHTDAKR